MYADGGARGNPGPAGAGAFLCDGAGQPVARLKTFLGHATNNQAEYAGVLLGLARAVQLGATAVELRLDSQLVVEQLSGRWRVKDAALQKLHARAHALLAQIPRWRAIHIPRSANAEADRLANAAMDLGLRRSAKTV